MTQRGIIHHTFEYDAPKGDPGSIELRIHYEFTPGTPESGRFGPPENYDPGGGHEASYVYAEREAWVDGTRKVWNRLKGGEWLDEFCQHWLSTREASDLIEGLPDGGEPDPDRLREDRADRTEHY